MKGAVPVGVCVRCLMAFADKHPSCIKTGTILLWNMREAGRVNRTGRPHEAGAEAGCHESGGAAA